MSESLSHYIKTHYGSCSKDKCTCIVYGWLGEKCLYWNTCGVNTYKELGEWQLNLVKARENE